MGVFKDHYLMSHKIAVSNANITHMCELFYIHNVNNNSMKTMAKVNLTADNDN